MNSRDLSEKLDQLAATLEALAATLEALRCDHEDLETELASAAKELRRLSNEKYAPGNSSTWADVRPKKPSAQVFTDSRGKQHPF